MPSPEASLGLDVTVEASAASGVTTRPARISVPFDPIAPPRSTLVSAFPSVDRHESGHLDHFVVGKRLGSGGMGAVYLAHDASLDRAVAIKILPDELALRSEAHERFIREAQAQARLSSPNVVQIYFIGRVPADARASEPPTAASAGAGQGSLYFAMELAPGGSLEALLERGERLDPELARRQMIQVARGLRDAHAEGIVHRDIKPGNLLLGRDGAVKIADFGLAKPRDPNLGLTRDGAVLGTPLYMAPEQALGEPLDHRADMYALGATFFHLLTGSPPFDAPNAVAMISKHLTAKPPRVRDRVTAVPLRLAAIVERLMAKDRAQRYATYDDLLAALDAAAPERIEHAGFWTRGAAAAIDLVLASLLIGALGPLGLIVFIAAIATAHGLYGQTLGKYLLRIEVQRLDGGRLGLPRALARTFAGLWLPFLVGLMIFLTQGLRALQGNVGKLAKIDSFRELIVPIIGSYAVLTLLYVAGFLVAAFHRQKRGAHDMIAGSQVVYRLGSTRSGGPLSTSSPRRSG
jgi:uncharacterized RDD family membrane protein YckC